MTAPPASSEAVRARMRAQPTRDTGPELALRRRLHAMGLRYRVDHPVPIPRRRADVVFTAVDVAVFVHGCWWHGCPAHHSEPESNAAWWRDKIGRNRARDAHTRDRLSDLGWAVVEVWEHDDPDAAADRVAAAVAERRQQPVY